MLTATETEIALVQRMLVVEDEREKAQEHQQEALIARVQLMQARLAELRKDNTRLEEQILLLRERLQQMEDTHQTKVIVLKNTLKDAKETLSRISQQIGLLPEETKKGLNVAKAMEEGRAKARLAQWESDKTSLNASLNSLVPKPSNMTNWIANYVDSKGGYQVGEFRGLV